MKFARVAGQRREAAPDLSGTCPCCDSPVIPKCGTIRVHHWAHKQVEHCDHWWENESPWHRDWKNHFPDHWQEFVYRADSGEKHVADVRTNHEWVIEFQRSYLTPEERQARDAFYRKLVWVIDATRRKTDAAQFRKALEIGALVGRGSLVRRVRPDECRLLQEWANSPAPIFFDFGPGPTLWWLLARRPDEPMYVAPWSRMDFIATHLGKGPEGARDFDEFTRTISEIVAPYNAQLRSPPPTPPVPPTRPTFQLHMARRRFRRL